MDQALHSLLQFHEGAVVGDGHDLAPDPGSNGVFLVDFCPGIGQELLEPQRDSLPVPIHVQDLDVHFLPDAHDLGGMTHPAPGHVGDVKETVEAAQIDKGPEVRDVLHHAFPDLSQEQLLHQGLPLLLPLPFQDHPARNDDVAATLVQLDDFEVVRLTQEVLNVRNPPEGDLRTRQEGVHPHEVHRDPALDLPNQHPLDRAIGLVGLLDLLPHPEEVGLLLGKDYDAFFVLQALEENFNHHPRLDDVGFLELIPRDGAFALEAEVQDHGGVRHPKDGGLDDLPLLHFPDGVLVLGQEGLEVVPGEIEGFLTVGIRVEVPRGRGSCCPGIQGSRCPGWTSGGSCRSRSNLRRGLALGLFSRGGGLHGLPAGLQGCRWRLDLLL